MSRGQRIALIAAALAVAVVTFLLLRPEGTDDDEQAGGTATTSAETTPTETTPTETTGPTAKPRVERIVLSGGTPRGGVRRLRYETGDPVRIVATSDAPDEIHIHGYDLTRRPAPGKPARFRFTANIEGDFEIESHVAEDAGKRALVARLVVEP
jgi:hypothetical protein